MNVKDCMNHHVIAVEPEESVAVASRLMARHNVGAEAGRGRGGCHRGALTPPPDRGGVSPPAACR